MSRNALRNFFRRSLPLLLPVLTSGCPNIGSCPTPKDETVPYSTPIRDAGLLPDALDRDACAELCANSGLQPVTGCVPGAKDGNSQTLTCHGNYPCLGGRRPESYAEVAFDGDEVGQFFARQAHLEHASIAAFERLADELVAHRAPARLVRAARAAARDEIRHARVTAKLARRFGGSPQTVGASRLPVRALDEIAVENAVEGCVRETWGAAVATLQAHGARDEKVRAAMRAIARDEERHAELAWQVDAWAGPRLDRAARNRVAAAREIAVEELAREIENEPAPALRLLAGLPPASAARALFAEARAGLWG